MTKTHDLLDLTGRALLACFGSASQSEYLYTPVGAVALTGERSADLNVVMVWSEAAGPFLARAFARAAQRDAPLAICAAREADPAIAASGGARSGGVEPEKVGELPLMALEGDATPLQRRAAGDVVPVVDAKLAERAGDLVAAAFAINRGAVARAVEPAMTSHSGAESWMIFEDGAARSVVTLVRTGSAAGVFTMATDPDHQGRGWGGRLLSAVIATYRAAGVRQFYLQASPAGVPLYQSLGFSTVAPLSAWLLDA